MAVPPLMRGWAGDCRDAARSFTARPTLAVGSMLLVTIAIAAVASGFAIVYGILWRPLPFPDPERLAVIWQVQGGESAQISYPDYADLAMASVFSNAAAMSGGRGSLRVGDRIERINVLSIEVAGLAMLGARPELGRLLTHEDADQPVAMISHRLWSTEFGGDRTIMGRQIWLSGREYTVVGVLQPTFDFELPVPPSFTLEDNDVWTTLDRASPFLARRDVSTYEALVKLAPGRSLAEGQTALDTMATTLARQYPASNVGRTFRLASLHDEVVRPIRPVLLTTMLAALVTLVVALANLLIIGLVRSGERQTEFAIRESLGAGSFRLRRRLLTEYTAVTMAGAVVGTATASQIVRALIVNDAADLPRPHAIAFDTPVLVVVAALTLIIIVVMSAQPFSIDSVLLRSGGRTVSTARRRPRHVLAACEIALAVTLTTAGALLALSLFRVLATDKGFVSEGAASARVSAYEAEYRTRDEVIRFFDDIVGALQVHPDVQVAAAGSSLPLSGQMSGTSVVAEGRPVVPGARPTAGWQFVTPGYFAAVGMRLIAGRDFTASERTRPSHVAIINQTLARVLFAGEDPLGQRIGVGGGDTQGDWHEIIGVVADVTHQSLESAAEPRVYDLFGQHWGRTLYVVARSRTGPATPLVDVMRRTVAGRNANVPVFELATLQMLVDRSAAGRRLASRIAMGLAGAALALALIGVYAVTSASVSERTREIGVRAALGAAPADLFRLVVAEAGRPIVAGGLAGTIASAGLVRLLSSHLFGIETTDAAILTLIGVASVAFAAAIAASVPGRRAAASDPVAAMQAQ